ncbi:mechanosensitive ion channel family protein [Marinomonas sp.]
MSIDTPLDVDKFRQLIEGKLLTWLEETVKLIPNLVVALITLMAFVIFANMCAKLVRKLSHQVVHSPEVTSLLSSIVRVAVVAIGFFVALDFIGLQGTVTSLLAGAGILGLAIGFAFQDMTENLISGVTMSIRRPFKIGDIVDSNGVIGEVIKIKLRTTIVETFSGQRVMIPNKMVFRNILTNYSRKGQRKIEIPVGISYADSLEKASQVIVSALQDKEYISDPEQTAVYATNFADSSVNLVVWFWIDYPGDVGYMDAKHDGLITVKKALEDADILIPFPIRTLDFGAKGGEKLSSMLPTSE